MTGSNDPAVGETTRLLSEYVVETEFEDIPEEVLERERWHVLDTLGCMLYGSTTPWVQTVVRALERSGERGNASVIGSSDHSLPPARAVLVNGTASHSMDYDDHCQEAGIHAGSATVPPALAFAETCDRTISGEEFLAAIAVGVEVGIRSGFGIGFGSVRRGWHIAGWTGAFGSVATTAHLTGLDRDTLGHALGIAGTQGCGLLGAQYGAEVKRFHMGKAAEAGYLAEALAGESLTGDVRIFEDRYGAIGTTMSDDYDIPKVTDRLGDHYYTLEKLTLKPFPSIGMIQAPTDALAGIVTSEELSPADIERVVVRTTEATKEHVGWEYEPQGVMAAQASIQYALATLLVDGEVSIEAYTEEAIQRPRVLDMVEKIDVVAAGEIESNDPDTFGALVEVQLTNGETRTNRVDTPRGYPDNPMSEEELLAKFRNQAGRVLAEDDVERVIDFVLDIESKDDVSDLVTLVS